MGFQFNTDATTGRGYIANDAAPTTPVKTMTQPGGSAVANALFYNNLEIDAYSTKSAGCTGSGDETPLLQGLIDAVFDSGNPGTVLINSDVRIEDNLYLYGNVSLIGDRQHRIIIDTDFDVSSAGGSQRIIACGTKTKGETRLGDDSHVWHGYIDGVNFLGTVNARVGILIFILEGQQCGVRNCNFDFTTFPTGLTFGFRLFAAVEGFNDSNWLVGGTNLREQIDISHNVLNTISYDNLGGEGFGINFGDGVNISFNHVTGCGDDPVVAHFAKNVRFHGNICKSVSGRIAWNQCQGVSVIGNYHERIIDSQGVWQQGGSLMFHDIEGNTVNDRYTENVTVVGNAIKVPSAITTLDGIVTFRGGQKVTCVGNTIINESATEHQGIKFLHVTESGWTGSIDGDDTDRPRHVVISNNSCPDCSIQMTGTSASLPGPYIIHDNVASSYSFFGTAFSFRGNRTRDLDGVGFTNVQPDYGERLLPFTFAGVSSATPVGSPVSCLADGIITMPVNKAARVAGIRMTTSTAVAGQKIEAIVKVYADLADAIADTPTVWTDTVEITIGNIHVGTKNLRTVASRELAVGQVVRVFAYGNAATSSTHDGNVALAIWWD